MTNTPESRLDRIERMLDTLTTNQINEREARLAQREDLEDFYSTIRQWAESTDRAINRLVENAEADRAAIREMQAEVQQIWQYLLSQQGNGHQG